MNKKKKRKSNNKKKLKMKETVNCGFWVSISFKKLGLKSFTECQHSKLIILIICSDPNSISHKQNQTKPNQKD